MWPTSCEAHGFALFPFPPLSRLFQLNHILMLFLQSWSAKQHQQWNIHMTQISQKLLRSVLCSRVLKDLNPKPRAVKSMAGGAGILNFVTGASTGGGITRILVKAWGFSPTYLTVKTMVSAVVSWPANRRPVRRSRPYPCNISSMSSGLSSQMVCMNLL